MIVVQGDAFNRSGIATVLCVTLTTQLKWAEAPGNVLLSEKDTGLQRTSVANVSQMVTVGRSALRERTGKLPKQKLELVLIGISLVLGR